MFLRTVNYWNLRTVFYLFKDKHPTLFWEPPLFRC